MRDLALLPVEEGVEHLVHERVFQGRCLGAHQPAYHVDIRQRFFVRERLGDDVTDLARGVGIIVFGKRQEFTCVVEFVLGIVAGSEPAAATRTTFTVFIGGQLDSPSPLSVAPAVFQFRALLSVGLALLVTARASAKR
ncbi:hypothetical protein [Amycolatopsis aidingensis]|uniref:hypothetical protein n=1 Tax=Amycolatopsis aidingensis TaxID=2842453 RepID=UPI001C0CE7A6|nr:hypothetical protein [Amycolatopsis aidingensis]